MNTTQELAEWLTGLAEELGDRAYAELNRAAALIESQATELAQLKAQRVPLTDEQRRAIQEGERNAAADGYFKPRDFIEDTPSNRGLFEAGFDRGYEHGIGTEAEQPAPGGIRDPLDQDHWPKTAPQQALQDLTENAEELGLYEKTAAGAVRAEKEVLRLRQALWDVYAALGFDTDGDATPVALVSDIAKLVTDAAREFRKDYDEAITEQPTPAGIRDPLDQDHWPKTAPQQALQDLTENAEELGLYERPAAETVQAELERAQRALEHVRQQASIWKTEATTQKATVDGVGAALGGIPDYGSIVASVEAMAAELSRLKQQPVADGGLGGELPKTHFKQCIDIYADKHPALLVRQLATLLRSAWLAASAPAVPVEQELTILDPAQWEPCSPDWLKAGGNCATAPRLWHAATRNHWHPKRVILESPAPAAPVHGELAAELIEQIKRHAGEYADRNHGLFGTLDSLPWTQLCSKLDQLAALATRPHQAVPADRDVTKIMIDVVPGEDGMGHEVYAKSVADVESLLTRMGQQIEDLQARPQQADWRKLALQFDGQRMAAMAHLKTLLDSPEQHAEAVRKFLAASPTEQQAGAVPDGWKLVPVEPTVAMLAAGAAQFQTYSLRHMYGHPAVWAAMLAASPTVPAQEATVKQDLTVRQAAQPSAGADWVIRCPEKLKPGGCQLHNLQCGWPKCNERAAMQKEGGKV